MFVIKGASIAQTYCLRPNLHYVSICHYFLGSILWLYQTQGSIIMSTLYADERPGTLKSKKSLRWPPPKKKQMKFFVFRYKYKKPKFALNLLSFDLVKVSTDYFYHNFCLNNYIGWYSKIYTWAFIPFGCIRLLWALPCVSNML